MYKTKNYKNTSKVSIKLTWMTSKTSKLCTEIS